MFQVSSFKFREFRHEIYQKTWNFEPGTLNLIDQSVARCQVCGAPRARRIALCFLISKAAEGDHLRV
jgi:hypothetical protein